MLDQFLELYELNIQSSKKLDGYGSVNYKLTNIDQVNYLIKIYTDVALISEVEAEIAFIDLLKNNINLKFTSAIQNKNNESLTIIEGVGFCRIMNYVEGSLFTSSDISASSLNQLGQLVGKMHVVSNSFSNLAFEAKHITWDFKKINYLFDYLPYIQNPREKKIALYFLDMFSHQVSPVEHRLPRGVIHNDLNEQNLIFLNGQLEGVIDFGDAVYSPFIYDLGILLCYTCMLTDDHTRVIERILKGYAQYRNLTAIEIDTLYYIIGARLATSVLHSSKEKSQQTSTDYILSSEDNAWKLLKKWIGINPISISKIAQKIFEIHPEKYDEQEVMQKRLDYFPSALRLSYDIPIHMHSAIFQYMFDQEGNTYLDAYNNIPLVGHNHPRISRVISEQIRKLNTNTRYQYKMLSTYAEQLLDVAPIQFKKVVFLNSGSAATDLAIRISRLYTGHHDIAVIDQGYHGNTCAGIEISQYKFDGKGGSGRKEFVISLPLVHPYITGDNLIREVTQETRRKLDNHQNPIAGIMAEPISGCGGQIPLDMAYVLELESYCRTNNIPFIIDEVQTGFGRVGTHFWAHQQQGLKPDIMIVGKPIGNGHPLAAVLMTEEISMVLNNGMEFFSSFGGNPISCAVGSTVLNILKEEELQSKSLEVGNHFISNLTSIQSDFNNIGDIRGTGLFLGIDLCNPETKENDGALAKHIKEYLKSKYLLTATDGKDNNVLKIRPPLCFNKQNVDQYCDRLREALILYKK